jgi:hypothetical protein
MFQISTLPSCIVSLITSMSNIWPLIMNMPMPTMPLPGQDLGPCAHGKGLFPRRSGAERCGQHRITAVPGRCRDPDAKYRKVDPVQCAALPYQVIGTRHGLWQFTAEAHQKKTVAFQTAQVKEHFIAFAIAQPATVP